MLSLRKLFAVLKAMRRPKTSFKNLEYWAQVHIIDVFYVYIHAFVLILFSHLYRYKVTLSIGKVMRSSTLNGAELAKLEVFLESVDAGKCIVYGRVLISGTLYSSTMYNRSDVTNDSIISLSSNGSTLIATVQKYASKDAHPAVRVHTVDISPLLCIQHTGLVL